MKVTLKTLSRETFEVEVDENLTVSDLKKKVEEVKGTGYAAENLKLIYAGKILTDDKVIKEYEISAFIVVMVSKPKTASSEQSSSSAAATPAPAPAVQEPAPTTPAAPTVEPTPAAPPATTPTTAPATTQPTSSDSLFVSGPAYAAVVANMESMGFEKAAIERAMEASYNNPHRAIEYLCNPGSMPAVRPAPQATPPAGGDIADAPTPAAASPPAAVPSPAASPQGAGNLDFLRNHAQFQTLRTMIERDPGMLQSVLQELGQANPDLLQAIQENPQQFINLLGEGGGGGAEPTGVAAPPPPATVHITPEEKAAIDRIKELGYPEHLCIQAYFACDKNENLAAEFLFSEPQGDDNNS